MADELKLPKDVTNSIQDFLSYHVVPNWKTPLGGPSHVGLAECEKLNELGIPICSVVVCKCTHCGNLGKIDGHCMTLAKICGYDFKDDSVLLLLSSGERKLFPMKSNMGVMTRTKKVKRKIYTEVYEETERVQKPKLDDNK